MHSQLPRFLVCVCCPLIGGLRCPETTPMLDAVNRSTYTREDAGRAHCALLPTHSTHTTTSAAFQSRWMSTPPVRTGQTRRRGRRGQRLGHKRTGAPCVSWSSSSATSWWAGCRWSSGTALCFEASGWRTLETLIRCYRCGSTTSASRWRTATRPLIRFSMASATAAFVAVFCWLSASCAVSGSPAPAPGQNRPWWLLTDAEYTEITWDSHTAAFMWMNFIDERNSCETNVTMTVATHC